MDGIAKLPNAYGATLPEKCLVVVHSNPPGRRVGMVWRFEMGYVDYRPHSLLELDMRLSYEGSIDELEEAVAHFNESLGVGRAQTQAMHAGTMFGWHVPAANPDLYDRRGKIVPAALR